MSGNGKPTGQELVLGFLKIYRKMSSIVLSKCAMDSGRILPETASRRMRELTMMPNLGRYDMPDYRVVSRKITAEEMKEAELKTPVQVHELVKIKTEPLPAQPTLMDIKPMTDNYGQPIGAR